MAVRGERAPRIAMVTALLALGLGASACGDTTYGEGSMLLENKGCDPSKPPVFLDEKGDKVDYGIDDLSVEWLTGEPTDSLEVSAEGPDGIDRVSEIHFKGTGKEAFDLTQLVGDDGELPWAVPVYTDEAPMRVSLDQLLKERIGGEDRTHVFELGENDNSARVSVEALPSVADPTQANGAIVTFEQDCVSRPGS